MKGLKDGEYLEKVSKGGHTFRWDPLVNDGTGFWEFVQATNGTKPAATDSTSRASENVSTSGEYTKKKAKKTVAFDESTKDATTLSVNKTRLLSNLAHLDSSQQAFIAQFVPKY